MQDIIHDEIFSRFPNFKRAIVFVQNADIKTYNPKIAGLLEASQAALKSNQAALSNNFQLEAWNDVHRLFGSNPNRFPPSIRSLTGRVLRDKPLPYINDAVALMNAVSLKYLVPCGGDDLDSVIGDLQLGFAEGHERFIPLGESNAEMPSPGEVIYFDSALNVMCRRWNWRNGDFSKVTDTTRNLLVNVDGIGTDVDSIINEAAQMIAHWLKKECSADTKCDILWADKRNICLS